MRKSDPFICEFASSKTSSPRRAWHATAATITTDSDETVLVMIDTERDRVLSVRMAIGGIAVLAEHAVLVLADMRAAEIAAMQPELPLITAAHETDEQGDALAAAALYEMEIAALRIGLDALTADELMTVATSMRDLGERAGELRRLALSFLNPVPAVSPFYTGGLVTDATNEQLSPVDLLVEAMNAADDAWPIIEGSPLVNWSRTSNDVSATSGHIVCNDGSMIMYGDGMWGIVE